VVAGVYALLIVPMPGLAAALAVTTGVALTGALHEDGLADAVDGLGGANREETLRIMRDPNHGTYGVLALVLSVVARIGAIAGMGVSEALVLIPLSHSLSRCGAIALMGALPPATTDGLGAAHADSVLRRQVAWGIVGALLVGLLLVGRWIAVFLLAAAIASGSVGLIARNKISGYTGDVLGAAQQAAEASLLVLGAGLSRAGLLDPVWWR
jgi:adenosylcobinamide-GDP ribazoletransferase